MTKVCCCFFNMGLGNDFLDMKPKAKATKYKKNKQL